MSRSAQTLSEADRRLLAGWAADCAEHVLPVFLRLNPDDARPSACIARARAFANGELDTAAQIRRRFAGGVPAGELRAPAAAAAARSAGQAVAVCHMGAHALGSAAYAVRAVALNSNESPAAVDDELHWQIDKLTPDTRAALQRLPLVGTDRSGPLGPGLIGSGVMGAIVRQLQDRLTPRA